MTESMWRSYHPGGQLLGGRTNRPQMMIVRVRTIPLRIIRARKELNNEAGHTLTFLEKVTISYTTLYQTRVQFASNMGETLCV